MTRLVSAIFAFAFCAATPQTWQVRITPDVSKALSGITADSMKAHLTYIASDALEGRDTPSKGLDLAADYLADHFEKAGLVAPVGGSYFQMGTLGSNPKPVRNVLAVLPGTDPVLKDTYVFLSAHYDHLGMNPNATGDKIFNGANDDGSGTVGVLEIATAFAKAGLKPKRSIVFALWFGEEKGLRGSRFYGRNPIFPMSKTVALVNLEMIGRADDIEGTKLKAASMTGYDFSDVPTVMALAAKQLGVDIWKHPRNSDAFFSRSDNQAFADQGVPAHALSATFIYPDYHKASDEVEKIDFQNMEALTRAVALGIWTLANSEQAPKWNADNPKAERYRAARGG